MKGKNKVNEKLKRKISVLTVFLWLFLIATMVSVVSVNIKNTNALDSEPPVIDNGMGRSITVEAGKDTYDLGEDITFTIEVTNNSNVNSPSLKIVDYCEDYGNVQVIGEREDIDPENFSLEPGMRYSFTAKITDLKAEHLVDENKIINYVYLYENDVKTEEDFVEVQINKIAENITCNYTVEWYDTDGYMLKAPETRAGTKGMTVSVDSHDKSVAGYTLVEDDERNILSATLDSEGTVLKLYFAEIIPYTVEWYDIYGSMLKATDTRRDSKDSTVSVTSEDKEIDGYTFVENDARNVLSEKLDSYNKALKLYFIANAQLEEKIKIKATKIWEDDNDILEKRPDSVILQIKNGENVVDEVEVTKDNNWSFEFEVFKYDGSGNEILYTIDEKETDVNYEKRVEGYTVINKYIGDEGDNQENLKDKEEENISTSDNVIDKNVDTSDINIILYVVIFIVAIVVIVTLILFIRKNKNNN